MFYLYLAPLATYFGPFNLFNYISFRCFGALVTALLVCFLIAPRFIAFLRQLQGTGQPIRTDGPRRHLKKAGTPTMGGGLILLSMLFSTVLWADLTNVYLWFTLSIVLCFALIGGVDDYLKVRRQSHRGISGALTPAFRGFCLCYGPCASTLYYGGWSSSPTAVFKRYCA